jgi:hypothetical protein
MESKDSTSLLVNFINALSNWVPRRYIREARLTNSMKKG